MVSEIQTKQTKLSKMFDTITAEPERVSAVYLPERKLTSEKLLRTAKDAIFAKDKAPEADQPDG